MTKEEAVKEIEKAFEPAFANYIITALTEGATVSDKEQGRMIAMGMTDKSLCNSCANIGEVCNYCYKCSLWTEKELATKNDLGVDCISRQAVRDTIFAECSGTKLDIDFAKVLLLQRAIKALPSVTPQEPIKGHWIKEESPYGWDGHSYQCSECGRSIHLDTEMEDLEDYPYCHCGAKMQEVEE